MRIKGTKMIVLTKHNLILIALLIVISIFCIVAVISISKTKSTVAFNDYKPIIETELLGKKEENILEKWKSKKTKVQNSILKSFFNFNENNPQNIESTKEAPIKEELISSEIKKVDKGMQLSNATNFDVNPYDFIDKKLKFKMDNNGAQILIVHTHTTESYSENEYPKNSPDRNLDNEKNIVAVGNAMAEIFEKNKISTYHDTTVHDYPSYNGAYQRAEQTIRKDIKNNSGIKVVLDVHRDGITKDDGTKVKLLTEIDKKKVAQVMLVVGTNSNLPHDNWQENFTLASKIQAKAIELYPSLMRPINLRKERFNEQITTGSLIVEIGTNGNTLEEAEEAGKMIADAISKVLKECE